MLQVPVGYQIGEAELGYITKLDEFRRQRIPLTPTAFCEKVGLAGTSSIRRMQLLKKALNLYGWQTAPARMRGDPPDLLEVLDLGPDPRVQALEQKVERLEKDLAAAEGLRDQLRRADGNLNEIRGLLMAFVAHVASSNAIRGRDIEQTLIGLIRERLPEEKVPDLVHGDSEVSDHINKLLDDVSRGR